MYGNPPIFLSPRSNREDFLESISIFDDDTGDPVNLSNTVTASGLAFSGTVWAVSIGGTTLFITLLSPLTIPVPPIGNQLAAFTFTFYTGQFIVPGQPIKIADPTGLNYMLGTVTSYNSNTGTLVSQIGNTFQFEIRRGPPRNDGSGYVPWYDFGTPGDIGAVIRASLGNGVMITDLGYLQVLIPEVTFRRLHLGTYHASMTMFDGTNTRQVFIANLPVLYGGVTQ